MPILNSAEHLRSAIIFVAQNQNSDGSFTSITRKTTDQSTVNHHTIFYPALIGTMLAPIKNEITCEILKKINYFLESETCANGLWSYWAKEDVGNTEFPYPTDLDDSSLAMAVQSDTKDLKTENLVNFVECLITNEAKPGGPYRTWITAENEEEWSDIDPVVNASVAYGLRKQKVVLANLNEYLVEKITTDTWRSPYYVSEPLMLFLLDRSLNGQCDTEIQKILKNYTPESSQLSLLDQALLVITMIHVGSDSDLIIECAQKMITACHTQAYADDPCILEKQTEIETEISGCPALTAAAVALALFSLEDYQSREINTNQIPTLSMEDQLHDVIVTRVAGKLNQLDPELFAVGLEEFAKLVAAPVAREITLISFDIGRAFGLELPAQLYVNLGAANLWGWLSYQLYDACYDEGAISPDLSLANICLREATLGYHGVAEEYHLPSELITNTLDQIDLAHGYELQERTNFTNSTMSAKEWLAVANLNLCERSFGHCLGPQLMALIGRQTKETQSQLKKLFIHYLNARQMCDDLHDWNEDYSANRLTGVTKPLFLSRYAFPTKNNNEIAKEIFWEEGIAVAIRQTQKEIEQALYIMKKIFWPVAAPVIITQSIERLNRALHMVAQEHQGMKTLIKHYT